MGCIYSFMPCVNQCSECVLLSHRRYWLMCNMLTCQLVGSLLWWAFISSKRQSSCYCREQPSLQQYLVLFGRLTSMTNPSLSVGGKSLIVRKSLCPFIFPVPLILVRCGSTPFSERMLKVVRIVLHWHQSLFFVPYFYGSLANQCSVCVRHFYSTLVLGEAGSLKHNYTHWHLKPMSMNLHMFSFCA